MCSRDRAFCSLLGDPPLTYGRGTASRTRLDKGKFRCRICIRSRVPKMPKQLLSPPSKEEAVQSISTSTSLLYLHFNNKPLSIFFPLISSHFLISSALGFPPWISISTFPCLSPPARLLSWPELSELRIPLMVLRIIYPVCWAVYHCHIEAVTEYTYTYVRTGAQFKK